MKILRIYGLIIGIIALINLGLYLKANSIIRFSPRIASIENWEEILVNKWEYEIEELHPMENVYYKGEIEYFPDGTYLRTVIYESFYKLNPYDEVGPRNTRNYVPDKPDLVANGPVTGKWEIGNGQFWIEVASNCGLELNHNSVNISNVTKLN